MDDTWGDFYQQEMGQGLCNVAAVGLTDAACEEPYSVPPVEAALGVAAEELYPTADYWIPLAGLVDLATAVVPVCRSKLQDMASK